MGAEAWPKVSRDFDLTLVVHRGQAVQAIETGNVSRLLLSLPSTQRLLFIADNVEPLKGCGVYEAAVLQTLVATSMNNHNVFPTVAWLLDMGDPERFREAGDPLPGSGPCTIFRGVAGRGRARRVRGFSWTGSLARAQWFATRGAGFGLHDPAVYRATVQADDVLSYIHDSGRREEEFIVRLPMSVRPDRVP